jgi:hypothetical protein
MASRSTPDAVTKETSVKTETKSDTVSPDAKDTKETKVTKGKPGGIDVLHADVFNKDMEANENLPWRKLTVEQRAEKLEEFFERDFNHGKTPNTIANSTQSMILKKAQNGELHLKKEIEYDRINQRVIKVHVLVPQQHTHHYVYQPDSISQKEKSRRSARNLLMRKRR